MRLFYPSPSLAGTGFSISNLLAIFGAALVLAGAAGVYYFGGFKDRYTEEKISENNKQTALAVSETARLNALNTRLELDLEKERIERLRLEAKVAPRSLSKDQKSALTLLLKRTGWKVAEVIWHGDGEPQTFARDFVAALEAAGIEVKFHTLGPFIPEAWGLSVVQTTNGDATKLKAILDKIGVASEIAQTNSTLGAKDYPTLFVGTREDMFSSNEKGKK